MKHIYWFIGFIFFGLFLINTFLYFSTKNNMTTQSNNQEQRIANQKETITQLKNENQQLKEQVENKQMEQEEKMSQSMRTATKELFSTVYTYDTANKEDSVKERKEKASALTDQKALEQLFPKGSEETVASVSSVSKLERAPEIYYMEKDGDEEQALVLIYYSVSIAGSKKQEGTFLYRVIYDNKNHQFTSIKNLGDIPLS